MLFFILAVVAAVGVALPSAAADGGRVETLYNGIVLGEDWPSVVDPDNPNPQRVPYLEAANIPKVIPIDVGRQLFVDDFLVAETNGVIKRFFKPRKYAGNPVLWPETRAELALDTELGARDYPTNEVARNYWNPRYKTAPACAATAGGFWWDPTRNVFRLWYLSGWSGRISLAESPDAIHWTRPATDADGANFIRPVLYGDTFSVLPDFLSEKPYENWRLYISPGGNPCRGREYVSKDGIHWEFAAEGGLSGDATTLTCNPFRGKWIWSIRAVWRARSRNYREHSDFRKGAVWQSTADEAVKTNGDDPLGAFVRAKQVNTKDCFLWLACDNRDTQWVRRGKTRPSQLYNFDATPYESVMVGLFKILCGIENEECSPFGRPKLTNIHLGYSRDGFHYLRPDRTPAIPESGWDSGAWDSGYLAPCSSGFAVKGDTLYFLYTGARGDATQRSNGITSLGNGMHAGLSIGLATLRRDGFAGFVADGLGEVLTRPVRFSGAHFFVNCDARYGTLAVEVCDADGQVFAGYGADDCRGLDHTDATKAELAWKGGDLARFAGQPIRFRFKLKTATLYAFWVSPSSRGESHGYVAAGGPGFSGLRDE